MHILANIPAPPGNAFDLGPLTVHYYGIAIAIGVLVAISILRRRYAKTGGDPDLADRIAIVAVVAGLIGARAGFVTTNYDRYFWDNLPGILAVWEGGLTFYTGLLFGAIAAILLLRRNRGSLPDFADAAAPAIPVAQAFGRWGNYFNQELYGTPTDLPWALEVEAHRRAPEYAQFATFHPTFLYELLGNIVIAATLVWVGKRGKVRPGSLLFGYLAGYGVLRFVMELIRIDTEPVLLGLTRNGLGSVAVFLVGVGGLWLHQRRGLLPDWSEGHDRDGDADVAEDSREADTASDTTAVDASKPQGPDAESDEPRDA